MKIQSLLVVQVSPQGLSRPKIHTSRWQKQEWPLGAASWPKTLTMQFTSLLRSPKCTTRRQAQAQTRPSVIQGLYVAVVVRPQQLLACHPQRCLIIPHDVAWRMMQCFFTVVITFVAILAESALLNIRTRVTTKELTLRNTILQWKTKIS